MRGKPVGGVDVVQVDRITPAGAGKTLQKILQERNVWDHPRRCGENLYATEGVPLKYRITPAGAGKTADHDKRPDYAEDHPRRCGENLSYLAVRGEGVGSPPQVRGKLGLCMHERFEKRITPAGAGKTIC